MLTTFAESRQVAPLSVGFIWSRTPQATLWARELFDIVSAIGVVRDQTVTPINVNVVFHLAGPHTGPDFEGVRIAGHDRAHNQLLVQTAVSWNTVSDPSLYPGIEVRSLLLAALDEAEAWAQRERVANDLESLRLLVTNGRRARRDPGDGVPAVAVAQQDDGTTKLGLPPTDS
jgi:hypothetical protein